MQMDIKEAMLAYHGTYEIGNADIRRIFGSKKSSATLAKMKKAAYEEMLKQGIAAHGYHNVNTAAAFKAWGIDITDLEKRYKTLKRLGLLENESPED